MAVKDFTKPGPMILSNMFIYGIFMAVLFGTYFMNPPDYNVITKTNATCFSAEVFGQQMASPIDTGNMTDVANEFSLFFLFGFILNTILLGLVLLGIFTVMCQKPWLECTWFILTFAMVIF